MIVIDTGPVVAAANRKDDYHEQCVDSRALSLSGLHRLMTCSWFRGPSRNMVNSTGLTCPELQHPGLSAGGACYAANRARVPSMNSPRP